MPTGTDQVNRVKMEPAEAAEEEKKLTEEMASVHIAESFKTTNDRILASLELYTGYNQNYTNNLSFAMIFNTNGASVHGLYGTIGLTLIEIRVLFDALDQLVKHKGGMLLKNGGWWTNGPTMWNVDLRKRETYKITASLFPRDYVHPRVELLGNAFCIQLSSKIKGIAGYFSDTYYAGMECSSLPDLHSFLAKSLLFPGHQEG